MEEKKDILVLETQSGDWQGLFINGNLIDEGHELRGEGRTFMYMLKQSELYNFKYMDVRIKEVNDEDEEYLMDCGNFPGQLSELKGTY